MEKKISKFLTGFRKLHGTQHSMITMLEKWRENLLAKKDLPAPYLWIYQRPLIQQITIFFRQSYMHMVSL